MNKQTTPRTGAPFYYISEDVITDQESTRNARGKARADIDCILGECGFEHVRMEMAQFEKAKSIFEKVNNHRKIVNTWMPKLAAAHFQAGDILFLQAPLTHYTVFSNRIFSYLSKRGVRLVSFVHDLDSLRLAQTAKTASRQFRIGVEERCFIYASEVIVVHNDLMKDALVRQYELNPDRIVSLNMFDYLVSDEGGAYQPSAGDYNDKSVVIAGNLAQDKTGYLYHLPNNIKAHLYGLRWEGPTNERITYEGSFAPDSLPRHLKGSYGLIWDGPSTQTCEGAFGNYLRINNPHKMSLFMASGIPVIVWRQAAIARIVQELGLGIVVDSLDEVANAIEQVSHDDYRAMCEHILPVSQKVRSGWYTRQAILQALDLLSL